MFTLSDFELGYIVGLLEGEGSITMSRNKTLESFQIQVSITNTNKLLLLRVFNILKIGRLDAKSPVKLKVTWKKCYQYRIIKQVEILNFLKLVRPYLIEKAVKADIIIKFLDSRLSKRRIAEPYSNLEYNLYKDYLSITPENWRRKKYYAIQK
jgi:hypothetical protein